jgi:hypothetical protein
MVMDAERRKQKIEPELQLVTETYKTNGKMHFDGS